MNIKKLSFLILIVTVLTACQQPAAATPGLSVKDQVSTLVAETVEAAPPTEEPTAIPTETPAPTATVTVTPTVTLTPTPTGPLKITDDFSSKSDIWGKCDKCEWKDGRLFFGPYPPRGNGIDQVFSIVCEACGEHSYFRIAADLTFADGIAGDREYGVGLTADGEYMAGTGIAPSLFAALEAWNLKTNGWTGSDFKQYGAVNAGTATNRVEFQAKLNAAGGTDYYAIVNGKTLVVLSNIIKYKDTLKPAIYLGWHSVGISIDNFEYEEIEPE